MEGLQVNILKFSQMFLNLITELRIPSDKLRLTALSNNEYKGLNQIKFIHSDGASVELVGEVDVTKVAKDPPTVTPTYYSQLYTNLIKTSDLAWNYGKMVFNKIQEVPPIVHTPPRPDVIEIGTDFVKLKWGTSDTETKSLNSDSAAAYELYYKIEGNPDVSYDLAYDGPLTEYTVNHLRSGATYDFRIRLRLRGKFVGRWSPICVTATIEIKSIVIRKVNQDRGGHTIQVPPTLEELLLQGSKLLNIKAIAVRASGTEALITDIKFIQPNAVVYLSTVEDEKVFIN